MSTDTDRFTSELRERLSLDSLHSTLDYGAVLTSSRRARRRRRARIGGALAGVLILGVVASPLGVDVPARIADAMRTARPADVDGLAGDLSAPLHVAWRADGTLVGALNPSGTLLLSDHDQLTAMDPNGKTLWSVTTGDEEFCWLASSEHPTGTTVARDGEGVVLCTTNTTGDTRLLDPQSGEIQTSVHVDWSVWWSVGVVDGDVIAAGTNAAGHVVATRWHPDGTVVWDQIGPVLPEATSGSKVNVTTAAIAVVNHSGTVQLDAATGEVLTADGPAEVARVGLPGGFTLVQGGGVALDLTVQAYAPNGTLVLDVPGLAERPTVDDGSVPGLLLVRDVIKGTVQAFDLTTGEELWHQWCGPSMVLDGQLIAWNSYDELQALDARTGDVLWQRLSERGTPDEQGGVSAVTDGHTVVTIEHDDQPMIIGLDLATGSLKWAMPWDGGYHTTLTPVPGGVVASGDGKLARLEP